MADEALNQSVEQTNEKADAEKKTYSAEEVEAMIEEGKKQAIADASKKAEEHYKQKQKEADRLARMNNEEKRVYELEQREALIAQKEHELALAESKTVASKILVEKGLSIDFVDFIVDEDADKMNANIKIIDKAFKDSVKQEVERRIGSKTPAKQEVNASNLTKKDFAKMSLAEQAQLYATDPEIYKSLI